MRNTAIKTIKTTISLLRAHPRQTYLKVVTLAALPVLAMCAIFAVSSANADNNKGSTPEPMLVRSGEKLIVPEKSPFRTRLKVATVTMTDIPHILNFPAVVEANPSKTVNVLPPLTGRLLELKVKLGDSVKQGQLLAVISSGDLAQAYSDYDKAKDALELARQALTRGKGVNAAGANAAKDLEQLQSNYSQAAAEEKRAGNRLNTLGVDKTGEKSRALNIAAPVSGTITALNNAPGAYINDATAVIMTISNLETVWVTASVPESQLQSISKGQATDIRLAAYPNKVIKGKVDVVSSILEPDTRRNKTRIEANNKDGMLKPNMFATVSVSIPQAKQIRVPTSALLMNNDSITVFVEVAPWTFVRKTVTLGNEESDSAAILSGLNQGDKVVVSGGVLLND
ncbi:efflux RND transporter periplasmic adaptor subunit [Undibacterium sp. Dicai25W]|uniref:efflux RND transporter periplasmic adaptor subunit n=1 Tax=Undibacterium sp. Dicai25W TaxID=3413034 RepID=UPI003BF1778E